MAIAILGTALAVAAGVFFTRDWKFEQTYPLLNKEAPEIEFDMPSGKASSLQDQRGTTIMLNFWATWCDPCMEEMPDLRALENHFKDRGFLLLAINVQDPDTENMKARISGEKMPQNLVFRFNRNQLRAYPIEGIPLSVIIDKKGVVRRVYHGPRHWVTPEMIREIETILNS